MVRVAFQGERGAFSEEAIEALFPAGVELVPRRTFLAVVGCVEDGDAEAGVLPVENTLAGRVHESCAALANHASLSVIAELRIRISQCLLAPPGATIESLQSVASHPVALAQCTAFLRRQSFVVRHAYDTAGAACEVALAGDRRRGAIASQRVGDRLGLATLATGIEDDDDNFTRFVAVTRAESATMMAARITPLLRSAVQERWCS
jgi:prephenate dehydratase